MGSRRLEGQGQSTVAVGEADRQPGVVFGASSEHRLRGALLGDKNHWGVRAGCRRRVQLSLLMWKAVVLLQ